MKKIIEQSRYLAYIGIIALFLTSIAAFVWGAIQAGTVIWQIASSRGQDPGITVALIEVVDAFLIAIAIIVFSVSMYELFIDTLNLPEWMLAHNLAELKSKLSSVIVLVLAVKFVEKFAAGKSAALDLLYMGLSVALVAGVLIAHAWFGKKD